MFSPQNQYANHVYAHIMQPMPTNFMPLSPSSSFNSDTSQFEFNNTSPIPRPVLQDIAHLNQNTLNFTRTNILKVEARRVREMTYQDTSKLQACHDVIEIMALTSTGLPIDEALIQLQLFHFSLDAETQRWIEVGSAKSVGSDRGRFASGRRRSGQSAIVCLWCASTFTGKHNLANHVRAHLDVHLSFCPNDGCTFSSTNTSLPSRHLSVCPRRPKHVTKPRQHSACSCALNAQTSYGSF